MAKNGDFGRKQSFLAQKNSLLNSNHVLATTGKSYTNKFQSFSQDFRCFFGEKTDCWPKKHFSAKHKNGRFSIIPAGTRSVVIVGLFLMAPTVPPSFADHGPKLRVLILAKCSRSPCCVLLALSWNTAGGGDSIYGIVKCLSPYFTQD